MTVEEPAFIIHELFADPGGRATGDDEEKIIFGVPVVVPEVFESREKPAFGGV